MIFSLCFFFLKTTLAATLHRILWQLIKIITHVLSRLALIVIISNKILTCRKLYIEFVFCRYLCNHVRWDICMYIYIHTHTYVCMYVCMCVCVCGCTYMYVLYMYVSMCVTHSLLNIRIFPTTSVQYNKLLICYHK
jgi:hypothetical protein